MAALVPWILPPPHLAPAKVQLRPHIGILLPEYLDPPKMRGFKNLDLWVGKNYDQPWGLRLTAHTVDTKCLAPPFFEEIGARKAQQLFMRMQQTGTNWPI